MVVPLAAVETIRRADGRDERYVKAIERELKFPPD